MAKTLIFCFDGTCNDPRDAEQDVEFSGDVDDSSITNVLKLHLLFGGDLRDGQRFADQRSFYYSGVGTYGNKFKRIVNSLFSPEHRDVATILRAAVADVNEHYEDGDRVAVFGFSRGAALARRFAAIVRKESRFDGLDVHFLGAFDTVASIGRPNLDSDEKPVSDVVFENRRVSPAVKEALHLVAIDERRKAFMPTLMNAEDRITEVWLPGAHADVGGGFRQDGLSDCALQFMLEEIERRALGLQLLQDHEIAYGDLEPDGADYRIAPDDVVIQPNAAGIAHVKRRSPLLSRITLADRDVRVIENDAPTNETPQVHWSAGERIQMVRDYRPAALRGVRHAIEWPNGQSAEYAGLREHSFAVPLRELAVNESVPLRCHSNLMMNHTKVLLVPGQAYVFDVDMTQRWQDAQIECGPDGWTRDTVQLGVREWFIRWKEDDRRLPDANWFELLGSIGAGRPFRVLQHTDEASAFEPAEIGELFVFVNDLESRYDNNAGSAVLTVRRVR